MTARRRVVAVGSLLAGLFVACGPLASSHAVTAAPRLQLKPGVIELGSTRSPRVAPCHASPVCYTPQQLQTAYNLLPLYAKGIQGQHQTIVIVDAYGSPTITADLASFDKGASLPAPPSFKIIHPAGAIPPYSPSGKDRPGWAAETSLDVEWAHALAPKAAILLVETPTDEVEGTSGFPDIVKAENYVIAHRLGSVISQSFTATEQTFTSFAQLSSLRSAYLNAQKANVTVLAGSGDLGATDYQSDARTIYSMPVTSWPASDPTVTAVGGTRLDLNSSGHAVAPPVAWNDTYLHSPPSPAASGGGRSVYFPRPAYQQPIAAIAGSHRAVPDISMTAACSAAVEVYWSFPGSSTGWHRICGTSEATPLFAAIVALADQEAGHSLGLINPALYGLLGMPSAASGLVDVTSGNNTVAFPTGPGMTTTVTGFQALAGYDLVTGVGTINGAVFVPALVREMHHLGLR